MLRSVVSSLKPLGLMDVHFVPSPVCIQCVRWARKPPWFPTAKSKIFRVPVKQKIPEEERVELLRLNNNYKVYIRAIRTYLSKQVQEADSASVVQRDATLEEEDHARCLKLNEEWNSKIAQIRDERLARQAEQEREFIMQSMIAKEEHDRKQLEAAEQIVREEKLRAKTYITPENIDRAIEEALDNIVDYNFAIDLDGNVFHGRKTKPTDTPSENQEKIQFAAKAS